MQRGSSIIVGVLATAALVGAVFKAGHPGDKAGSTTPPSASTSAPAAPAPAPSGSAAEADDPLLEPEPGGEWATDAGASSLPASAPTAVHFGVVLFTYQGVQFAPKNARTKDEAHSAAKDAIELAKKDFAAAVKQGDRGSTADAGRIPRGVLEPEIEYHLFTLEKGAVYPEPIDTPRGFWILRRNE
jgi:hypothetical protein